MEQESSGTRAPKLQSQPARAKSPRHRGFTRNLAALPQEPQHHADAGGDEDGLQRLLVHVLFEALLPLLRLVAALLVVVLRLVAELLVALRRGFAGLLALVADGVAHLLHLAHDALAAALIALVLFADIPGV